MSKKRKIICTLLIIFTLVFALTGCKDHTRIPEDSNIDKESSEWVSPDGVHYWYWRYWDCHDGFGWVLSPRYDRTGKLVIDQIN